MCSRPGLVHGPCWGGDPAAHGCKLSRALLGSLQCSPLPRIPDLREERMAKGGRETAKEGKGIERKEEKEGGGEGFEELERSEI